MAGRPLFIRIPQALAIVALTLPLVAWSAPPVKVVLLTLGDSTTGRQALERAKTFWNESDLTGLEKHIEYGGVSRTDAVLTRHYNPVTGDEVRERTVTIILKKEQPFEETVLDLAHELKHATTKPSWDPYDPALTPGRYIWAALEAEGGEVDAVTQECQVALELADSPQKFSVSRCNRYITHHAISRVKVRGDFYRVGRWEKEVRKRLTTETTLFPELSSAAPELFSATGGAPYPIALIREYDELNRVACENVRRRLSSNSSRAPASVQRVNPENYRLLDRRCANLRPSPRE